MTSESLAKSSLRLLDLATKTMQSVEHFLVDERIAFEDEYLHEMILNAESLLRQARFSVVALMDELNDRIQREDK